MTGGLVSFYATAAQVIPVLVLVLIVEQRDEKRRLPLLWNLVYVLVAVVAAIVGEVVSLQDTYLGRPPAGDEYWVVIPLALLTAALVVPVVTSALGAIDAEGGWRSRAAWAFTTVATFGIVVITLAASRR